MLETGIMIYTDGKGLDYRYFGQILPQCSIPVCFMDGYENIQTITSSGTSYNGVPQTEDEIVLYAVLAYAEAYPDSGNICDEPEESRCVCDNMGDDCKLCVDKKCTIRVYPREELQDANLEEIKDQPEIIYTFSAFNVTSQSMQTCYAKECNEITCDCEDLIDRIDNHRYICCTVLDTLKNLQSYYCDEYGHEFVTFKHEPTHKIKTMNVFGYVHTAEAVKAEWKPFIEIIDSEIQDDTMYIFKESNNKNATNYYAKKLKPITLMKTQRQLMSEDEINRYKYIVCSNPQLLKDICGYVCKDFYNYVLMKNNPNVLLCTENISDRINIFETIGENWDILESK